MVRCLNGTSINSYTEKKGHLDKQMLAQAHLEKSFRGQDVSQG